MFGEITRFFKFLSFIDFGFSMTTLRLLYHEKYLDFVKNLMSVVEGSRYPLRIFMGESLMESFVPSFLTLVPPICTYAYGTIHLNKNFYKSIDSRIIDRRLIIFWEVLSFLETTGQETYVVA